MTIRGDLDTLSLAQLFQLLAYSRKEGTLTVTDGTSTKRIYFGGGGIRLVSLGYRKALRLGELLLRDRRIVPTALEQALKVQRETGRRLGEILEEMKILSADQIRELVQHQIQDEIFDLFRWPKASFEFDEGPLPREVTEFRSMVTELAFDVEPFLMEALRVADEKMRDLQRRHEEETGGGEGGGVPAAGPEDRVILVVDDIPQVRKILMHELVKAGYRTLEAKHGVQALEVLRKERIHAVIVDAMMPEMDGFALCRVLRANPAWQKIPVLFLSARHSQDDIFRALQAGAQDYLVKPYKRDVLLEHIRKLLPPVSRTPTPAPPAG